MSSKKRSTDGFNNPADWALSQSNDEGVVSPLEPLEAFNIPASE